jgi:aldehyde:ferredoxin oxidoreductase
MERIAKRQGIGAILAQGVKKAAAQFGSAAVPVCHARQRPGTGWLECAGQSRFCPCLRNRQSGRQPSGGASIQEQHRRTFLDALCVCRFVYGAVGTAPFQKALSLATGWQCDDATMLAVGERIWNLEKLFNAREGFRRVDDQAPRPDSPKSLFSTGPKKGANFSAAKQDQILDNYYEGRGWDKKTSLPNTEKLKALGLDKLV